MAMEGLFALICAGAVAAAAPASNAPPPAANPDGRIASTLAVQMAMQQGRQHLMHNNTRAAVEVLDSQLDSIDGNPAYLALLREAYRSYVHELKLANQEAAAQEYIRRLLILEGGTGNRISLHGNEATPSTPALATSAPKRVVRGKIEETEDPFQPSLTEKRKKAHDLVERAEKEFGNSRFRQAGMLFEQAYQEDQSVIDASRPRWAYCKLDYVVEQLNHQSTAYANLENEVRSALVLAPTLDFGKALLTEIQKRRSAKPSSSQHQDEATVTTVAIHDLGRNAEGWSVLETPNFHVYHNQSAEMAEQVARVAEHTRTRMQEKWFGRTGPDWNPRCDIFLHATGQDYSQATGVPSTSPGHSSFRLDGGKVIGRRIDLHCDDINMLNAVLPHEATHTVLAGNFGDQPVPRWADEGMAVLTEPREKVERHLRNLPKHYQDGQLFSVRQLMTMNEYPEARYIGPFYAESVSLVDFLSTAKSPQVFTQFVRDGLSSGYEAALQHHYGYRDFADLDQDWKRHVFGEVSSSAGAVPGNR